MRYIVTKAFRPKGSGGPMAAAGSEIELDRAQAHVFKALGWVKEAAAQAAAPTADESRGTYFRRDMVAAEPSAHAPAAKKVAAKKTIRSHLRRIASE